VKAAGHAFQPEIINTGGGKALGSGVDLKLLCGKFFLPWCTCIGTRKFEHSIAL
jgi:hypothetical protein